MADNGRRWIAVLLGALALAGCSWVPDEVNPVAWYRDLSGASKNDALDTGANQKNLEAGGNEPYPNLASVPNEPSTATSQIDRDALQKSLVADRANALYSDEQLRAGLPLAVAAPPPAPAPPPLRPAAPGQSTNAATQQQAAAAPPAESSLKSPTIPEVPQGESPAAPPPPPNLRPAQVASAAPPSEQTASVPAGRRRAVTQSQPVGSVAFTGASTALSDEELKRIGMIAAMQHAQGGALRVVGHAAETGEEAQQKMQSFTLALARAKEVAQALSSEGVPKQQIAVEAVPSAAGDAAAATAEIFLER